jgi:hypothetical protein
VVKTKMINTVKTMITNTVKTITNTVNNKLDIVEEKLKQMILVKQEPDYVLDVGLGIIILIGTILLFLNN